MNLKQLYNIDININGMSYDTRELKENDAFFCINESSYDYIDQALSFKPSVIFSNRKLDISIPCIVVEDVTRELSRVSSLFYNNPSSKLKNVGITGTDGKTTTSIIIQNLLNKIGKCGYVGTNGVIYGNFNKNYFCTTPFPPLLYKSLNDMVNDNQEYLVIEATSHGLDQSRVEDITFDIGLLTNITKDHLDYHKTLENYINAKLHLIDLMKEDATLIVNNDDNYSTTFIKKYQENHTGIVYTYGLSEGCSFRAINVKYTPRMITFDLSFEDKIYPVKTNLIGKFNIYNILAAIATIYSLNHPIESFIEYASELPEIDGRSHFVENDLGIDILIDFAHTPNGIESMLSYLREACDLENKKLKALVGCPGKRDKSKRAPIGVSATTHSDYVYFTSEDPRNEDPNEILKDVISEVTKDNYEIIVDRKDAIRKCLSEAKPGDFIALLGKGIENKFAIGDVEYDYLEEDVVLDVLNSLK